MNNTKQLVSVLCLGCKPRSLFLSLLLATAGNSDGGRTRLGLFTFTAQMFLK